jgi:folate-binding protein YgfZ
MRSALHDLHQAAGARFGEFAGCVLPRDYGDPRAEYAAVRGAAALIDRGDQAQLRMWGRDPVKMLHGLITNDLLSAPPGRAVYAAMLTPKGRVVAEMRAMKRSGEGGADILIDVPREALDGTVEHFRKFVPPLFARWSPADEVGVLGVYGPRAAELLGRLGHVAPLEEDEFLQGELGGESVTLLGTRYAGGEPGTDVFAGVEALPGLWRRLLEAGSDLGVRPAGQAALETLRIEAGRPRFGHELTQDTIPTEAFQSTGMMERAISFSKGCYTGQEVIVRIAHRGHVNRHLRGLRLGDGALPEAGTRLFGAEGGRDVGWTASAAESPLLGENVALAYLRREIGPGDRVRIGSPDGPWATAASLPFSKEE